MIYLKLFLTFLKIGAVSFGGGYGMIALIREDVIGHGWLTEEELMNFIAVSESTPGPIAVNMATFIGSSQGGFLGAFLCTLGVVLPSFIIILLISAILNKVLKYAGVQSALQGMRPVICGLIISTAVIMLLDNMFAISTINSKFCFDWKALVVVGVIAVIAVVYRKLRKKTFSPILLIVISGILGVILYI